jgi:hypothetical protein
MNYSNLSGNWGSNFMMIHGHIEWYLLSHQFENNRQFHFAFTALVMKNITLNIVEKGIFYIFCNAVREINRGMEREVTFHRLRKDIE